MIKPNKKNIKIGDLIFLKRANRSRIVLEITEDFLKILNSETNEEYYISYGKLRFFKFYMIKNNKIAKQLFNHKYRIYKEYLIRTLDEYR